MKKSTLLLIAAIIAFASCEKTPPYAPEEKDDNSTEVPVIDEKDKDKENENENENGGQTTSPEEESVLVFSENFDGNPDFSGSYMSDSDWRNPKGEGAKGVSYESWNGYIRNDSYGSSDKYEGASGAFYGRLQQSKTSGSFGYLNILGISTLGYKEFSFSFGASQGSEVMQLKVSADGSAWTEIEYDFPSNYNSWDLVTGSFTVPEGTTTLSLRFELIGSYTDYAYGASFDDICLKSKGEASGMIGGGSGGGDDGGYGGLIGNYAECPAFVDNSDYYYNTLFTHTVRSGLAVRNYSFCYDTRRHNPIWVAFPMHSIYAEGSGRSKNEAGGDPWIMYPDLPLDKQSIIWPVDGTTTFMYWSAQSAIIGEGSWTKGHLCMSSSRSGAGEEINLQTFYPVNIAPQSNDYAGAGIFDDLWAATEDLHWQRGSQVCSDTLYVVAGCFYENDSNVEYDACNWNNRSEYSKACVVPTHQYKLFLRTRSGYTGKAVQNCSASELKCIGFWMDSVLPVGSSGSISDYATSVEEIEKKTGITFFPGIPAEVKKQCNTGDWL